MMEREALLLSERLKKRVIAIESLKDILSAIDFTVEEVPIDDSDRFLKLLQSLKNDRLSIEEKTLVDEIIVG